MKNVIAFVFFTCVFRPVSGSDLEITVRAHTNRIVFGDPLFLEVTIVNRGKEPVAALRPDIDRRTFEFRACDSTDRLEINCRSPGLGGGMMTPDMPILYQPSVPHKHRWSVFLPYASDLDHPFWKDVQNNRFVRIWGLFWLTPNMALKSNTVTLRVDPRSADEMDVLKRWSPTNQRAGDTTIHPSAFGVALYSIKSRHHMSQVVDQVKSGELAGLLQLTLRLQDMYHAPETREAGSVALVDWVRTQPDIKRQVLAKQLRGNYEGLITTAAHSTFKEIEGSPP